MRLALLLLAASMVAGAAAAQTPKSMTPKSMKLLAELKTGRSIEVEDPDIIDGRLCGWMRAEDEPASLAPRAGCIAIAKIARAKMEGARFSVGASLEGSLCMVVMPLCLAKVAAVEDAILAKAIGKAKVRPKPQ